MKKYTTKVLCRGCHAEIVFGLVAPKVFCERDIEAQCDTCGSSLLIQIRQGKTKKKILTRVKMVRHTEKLLQILEGRRLLAQDHTQH